MLCNYSNEVEKKEKEQREGGPIFGAREGNVWRFLAREVLTNSYFFLRRERKCANIDSTLYVILGKQCTE